MSPHLRVHIRVDALFPYHSGRVRGVDECMTKEEDLSGVQIRIQYHLNTLPVSAMVANPSFSTGSSTPNRGAVKL
jgi:hypothetical protein